MKNKNIKKRRQINIPKEDYIKIQEFCRKNGFDMPKWIVIKLLEIINKENTI